MNPRGANKSRNDSGTRDCVCSARGLWPNRLYLRIIQRNRVPINALRKNNFRRVSTRVRCNNNYNNNVYSGRRLTPWRIQKLFNGTSGRISKIDPTPSSEPRVPYGAVYSNECADIDDWERDGLRFWFCTCLRQRLRKWFLGSKGEILLITDVTKNIYFQNF